MCFRGREGRGFSESVFFFWGFRELFVGSYVCREKCGVKVVVLVVRVLEK